MEALRCYMEEAPGVLGVRAVKAHVTRELIATQGRLCFGSEFAQEPRRRQGAGADRGGWSKTEL